MRYAIVSDIHANIQAWNAVLKDIKKQGVDAILCLGDVIGYGPNPAEVLDSCYQHVDYFILGNHDAVIGNRMSSDLFNDNAKYLIEWTRDQLSDASEKFFAEMPLIMEGENFACAHAELAMPGRFSYLLSGEDCKSSFEATSHPIMFVGHTHRPAKFIYRENSLEMAKPGDFYLQGNERYLVNVGSVGDPRDGSIAANYCLFDEEDMFIRNRQVPFDLQGFKRNLLKASLPVKPYFINVADGLRNETATIRDMKVPAAEHVKTFDKVHYVQQDTLNETRTRRLQRKINFSPVAIGDLKKNHRSTSTTKSRTRKSRNSKSKKTSWALPLVLAILLSAILGAVFVMANQSKEHTDIVKTETFEQEAAQVEEVQISPSLSSSSSVTSSSPTSLSSSSSVTSSSPTLQDNTNQKISFIENTHSNQDANVKVSLKQSSHKIGEVNNINLSSDGTLDWAVWDGGASIPKQVMLNGQGFKSFTSIGGAALKKGDFRSQNSYSWTNGENTSANTTNLAGKAELYSIGDGMRLDVIVDTKGKYQLKFYVSTYQVNLKAKVSLSSSGAVGESTGQYVSDSVQRYEFTVDFTTDRPDSLSLVITKATGQHFLVAQEAFSLKKIAN